MVGSMQVAGRAAMLSLEKQVLMFAIALVCFVSIAIAASCLLVAKRGSGLIVAFVTFHGAGYDVTIITRALITADLLERQNLGTISGMLAVPFMLSIAISPTLAAIIWEYRGYDLVIKLSILAARIGLLAVIMAGKSAGKKAKFFYWVEFKSCSTVLETRNKCRSSPWRPVNIKPTGASPCL